MGIGTIFMAAAKHISWERVANIALQYGPDIVRQIRDRLQTRPNLEDEASITVEQLSERIRELESALVKQGEIIEQQNRNMVLLEEIGKTLQARLNLFMAISALSAVLSLILCVLLLIK